MGHKLVLCPYCQSDQVVKRGKTDTGKQRYRCHNPECDYQSFLLDPAYKGRSPEIKQQVIEMSLNGSGIRNTARWKLALTEWRPLRSTKCGAL